MTIDILFLIIAGYGFYVGFTRGIIKSVFTILSVMFGIIAAAKFGPSTTDFLESLTGSTNPLMFLAGILITFLLVMMLVRFLASSFEKALETANINILNQGIGGLVLAAIFTAVYSTLVLFGDRSHIIDEETKFQSYTYDYLIAFPPKIGGVSKKIWPVFTDLWDHSVDFMDRLEKMEKSETNQVYDIEEDSAQQTNR